MRYHAVTDKASITLYPDIVLEGDQSPEFDKGIDERCEAIYEACKGWGTDKELLIDAITNTDCEHRYKIHIRFEEIYGTDLKDLMKKECGGDFGEALQLLALGPAEAEAKMIKNACKGIGAREEHIYPIICGRSNADMEVLKKAYYNHYGEDMGVRLASELGGDFESLVFNCLQGVEEEFDPEVHTDERVEEDADTLYEAGQGRWGTNEKGMFKVLCAAPPAHLKNINLCYAEKYGYTIPKAFEKELGGSAKKAALFIIGMKLKPFETIARLIKSACAGFGTDETQLTNCLVRYQNLLTEVDVSHIALFGKSIKTRVESETSGDYEKLLLQIVPWAEDVVVKFENQGSKAIVCYIVYEDDEEDELVSEIDAGDVLPVTAADGCKFIFKLGEEIVAEHSVAAEGGRVQNHVVFQSE